MDTRTSGHHLAIAASIRILAREIAKMRNPQEQEAAFVAIGQRVFQYVDDSTNPQFSPKAIKEIKESAYSTLRMIWE